MTDNSQKTGPHQTIQVPIDTNNDMSDTTDTHGMTGMTKNYKQNTNSQLQSEKDATPPTIATMSSEMVDRANDVASETDDSNHTHADISDSSNEHPSTTQRPQTNDYDTSDITSVASSIHSTSPEVQGELAVNASNADPESDDDTLENMHSMGFQLEEDTENPKELNMAADFDKAEEEVHK